MNPRRRGGLLYGFLCLDRNFQLFVAMSAVCPMLWVQSSTSTPFLQLL